MGKSRVANRIRTAVAAVVPAGVEVVVSDAPGELFQVRINRVKITAAWVGEGRLRHIHRLFAEPGGHPDLAVARRLSTAACELLRKKGVGWVDESGAAEIAAGTVVVSRTGMPEVRTPGDDRWTASVIGVTEALLVGTKATVEATAKATGLSTGSCTSALGVLTRLGHLSAAAARGRASSRRVMDPDKLLDAYVAASDAAPRMPNLKVGVLWRDTPAELVALGKHWDKAGVAWATTGAAAASVIAPLLTAVTTADVYVEAGTIAELVSIAGGVGLKPIEGGRLTLSSFPTSTTMRLATSVNGLRVAPWPRVYADLHRVGVRGEEAAEHLREVVRG